MEAISNALTIRSAMDDGRHEGLNGLFQLQICMCLFQDFTSSKISSLFLDFFKEFILSFRAAAVFELNCRMLESGHLAYFKITVIKRFQYLLSQLWSSEDSPIVLTTLCCKVQVQT